MSTKNTDLYIQLVDLDTAIAEAKRTIEGLEYTLSEYPHCSATLRRIGQWEKVRQELCFNALKYLMHPDYASVYDAQVMPNLQDPSTAGGAKWTF
jgi:hypothetical protein